MFTEEDKYDLYAKVMLKYFMAEGVVTSQSLLVASQDTKPSELVSGLPAVINDSEPEKRMANVDEQMKIAWRYQNMKMVDSSPKGSQTFGHFYDLTKSIQQELLEQTDIKEWHENNVQRQSNIFENSAYTDLLCTIQETLENGQYFISETPEKRKILRIAIHSLGSRLWLCDTENSSHQDLSKFLYCFRALLRSSYSVGLITIPVNNFENAVSFGNCIFVITVITFNMMHVFLGCCCRENRAYVRCSDQIRIICGILKRNQSIV